MIPSERPMKDLIHIHVLISLGCFFLLSLNKGTEQPQLTGFDLFLEVPEGTVASKPFQFEEHLTQRLVTGFRAAEPALTFRNIDSIGLTNREVGGAPMTGIGVTFKASTLRCLEDNKAPAKKARLVVLFDGVPLALVESALIKQLVEDKEALIIALPVHTSQEYDQAKARIQRIKDLVMPGQK